MEVTPIDDVDRIPPQPGGKRAKPLEQLPDGRNAPRSQPGNLAIHFVEPTRTENKSSASDGLQPPGVKSREIISS
jgi:hypothetical protein